MLTKRAQILFDQTTWKQATTLAKEQQSSIGHVVRTAIQKVYADKQKAQEVQKIVEKILTFRKKHGKNTKHSFDSATIVRQMRDQRYGKNHLRRLSSY